MKKAFLLLPLLGMVLFSCQKPNVNVYTGQPTPPYLVSGVHDITFVNGSNLSQQMSIYVQYEDSAQETVSLSFSAMPPGITMDTSNAIMAGLPTFNSYIYFYDTSAGGAPTGIYPVTLTAYGSRTGGRIFSFNIKVQPQPLYSVGVVGVYGNSQSSCISGTYADTCVDDASVRNKIWFNNFGGYGIKVYGTVNASHNITIPSQVSGNYTVSGNGYMTGVPSYLFFSNMRFFNNSTSAVNYCTMNMSH